LGKERKGEKMERDEKEKIEVEKGTNISISI
jgi:hypothetical protein